jgi:hypothetical protein
MTDDDRFEELMRDAAHTYRKPPRAALDEMWTAIEAAHFESRPATNRDERTTDIAPAKRFSMPRWVGIAATLVIGVGIGRASMLLNRTSTNTSSSSTPVVATVATVASAATHSADGGGSYDTETSKYLGQTAALLIALPSEVRGGRADDQFVSRANELLSRTRLLIDSPAANDPQMRTLLEDLELVLAQVVRLQNNHNRTELDLINRALEQRDVIPRLRTAVADISAN